MANGEMGKSMALEDTLLQIKIFMRVNLLMEIDLEKVVMLGQMEVSTKANGSAIR